MMAMHLKSGVVCVCLGEGPDRVKGEERRVKEAELVTSICQHDSQTTGEGEGGLA